VSHTPYVTSSSEAAESWAKRLAPYREPDHLRSAWQLGSTLALYVGAWLLMWASLAWPYWVTWLLGVPTAFFLVRLFIIQHDCGHGSFFKSQRLANIVGAALGALTLTPYQYWRRAHAVHHASSGNLEHRGFGDIDTLTVREYEALDRWGRFKYRVYRHPLILFGIGAVLHFVVLHRLPWMAPPDWKRERRSILWTNLGLVALVGLMSALVGLRALLLVQVPIVVISCSIGVWLFYVQHQFEPTYWEHDDRWDYDTAAIEGSSYYVLPPVLQWATGNIGLHHVHHLNARIPNYRLQKVLETFPELNRATRITIAQSVRCMSLALWDEQARLLVPLPSLFRRAA
jgi:omega-6 fatty acid desaturase (delta-12 desaturase)